MKFYHVIDNRQKRNAGITIAAVIVPFADDPERCAVFCGLSYCAPVERQFSRPRGRLIAQSRLSSTKTLPGFKRFDFTTDSADGLKTQILSRLGQYLENMNWAQTLIDRELERLDNVRNQRLRELERLDNVRNQRLGEVES
jgi:hypothetical protein